MDKRKELIRILELMGLLAVILACFLYLLYDLQIIHTSDYQVKAVKKAVGRTETVSASRGEIFDRCGRSMVTNQLIYQVTLDPITMADRKQEILLGLIYAAREQGVTWPDSLPLTRTAPYTSQLATVSESARKNYISLASAMGWKSVDGSALLQELRQHYGVAEDLSDADARDLVGILYELDLRAKEVVWSSYIFAQRVDISFISAVRERSLSGVNVSPVTVRKYATTAAPHILGRTGLMDREEWQVYKELGYAMNETVGKDGVEHAFEALLRGAPGTQVVERNANGKIVSQTWKEEPSPGYNVYLTLDIPLQEKMEQVLAEKLPALSEDAEGGAAVMIEVDTGAVLGMASYPDFDLTTLYTDADLYREVASDPLHPLVNRATMGLYPPGSTFKMLVATAALQEDIIEPNTLVKDTGLYTYYGTANAPACWIYRQYRQTHGSINVSKAIEVSCNVFFYDVGRRLGIEKLDLYARMFGLGEPTGIEIPEYTGVVAGPEYSASQGVRWYEGNVMFAAIGQESNQFTPLQLANYTATLANGGTHYAAHLLKTVKSNDFTQTIQEYEPQVLGSLDIAPENLAAVKKGMLDLTTTGSLRSYFQDLDFQVGAKTGSAQVNAATSNAVFVCFAPYDDPKVALALVAEHGGSGSSLAELAAEILDYYFSSQSAYSPTLPENTLLP